MKPKKIAIGDTTLKAVESSVDKDTAANAA
jgi:hypothetical protein